MQSLGTEKHSFPFLTSKTWLALHPTLWAATLSFTLYLSYFRSLVPRWQKTQLHLRMVVFGGFFGLMKESGNRQVPHMYLNIAQSHQPLAIRAINILVSHLAGMYCIRSHTLLQAVEEDIDHKSPSPNL